MSETTDGKRGGPMTAPVLSREEIEAVVIELHPQNPRAIAAEIERLTRERMMERVCHQHGITLVPTTGPPSGWLCRKCASYRTPITRAEHIARQEDRDE